METLVVGAGLAGLVVAYRLHQGGQAVTVIEARDRPGGRVFSLPQALGTPSAAELGGEAFDSDHVASLTLAQSFGLPIVDLWQGTPPQTEEWCWFDHQHWPQAPLLAEFTDRMQARGADIAALQQFLADGIRTPAIAALDTLSIPQYLAQIGCSGPVQRWVEVAYTIKYGFAAAAQSCLNLLLFFRSLGDCAHLFGYGDERFYLRGGNGQLPQALATALGNRLQLNTALGAVETNPQGGYTVTLTQGERHWTVDCDRLVLTLPFSVLRTLPLKIELPPPQRRAIAELTYNTATKIITAYHHKPWQSRASQGVVYTDLPLSHCWEATDSTLTPGPGLMVAYPGGAAGLAAAHAPLETIHQQVLTDLETLFPGLQADHMPGAVVRSPWLTDNRSRGAYSVYQRGQWSTLFGWEGRRAGQVWFAGEHCSRRYQGYMEGACETGEQVAWEILTELSPTAATAQGSRLEALERLRSQGFRLKSEWSVKTQPEDYP